MSERRFLFTKIQTQTFTFEMGEAEAREAFPDVRWDEPSASVAAEIEEIHYDLDLEIDWEYNDRSNCETDDKGWSVGEL